MATTDTTNTSSSVSAFISTLIPVLALAIVFLVIFLLMRTKYKRVYRPRTYLGTLYEQEKSEELPEGRFNWFGNFRHIPDEYVLNHQSLDGYLYLRFLKMIIVICFVGSLITWPVLFPVNATGDGGHVQFDLLSFANIGSDQKNRYYAHVFVAWIFFSFVMWIITRETKYFINIRHAYLLAPFNAAKISSRTVLFTDVPVEYQNKEKLLGLFGASVRRTWLATDCSDLTDKVEERDKDAFKLEGAEMKLIKAANDRRLKWEKKAAKADKKGTKKSTAATPDPDAEAVIPGSQYQKEKDRPKHRLGKIPFIGKKVDTIEWSRTELIRLIPEVEKEQIVEQKFNGKLLPAVFVEFNTQAAAEAAFRRMSPKKAPKMNPRAIGNTPEEIIWKNLKIKKTERMGRKVATQTFITLMILFWAIPVAIVGLISNINYLTTKVTFLSFIDDIPPKILGVVTGLLPTIMLSVLMALVPIVCRWMAKLSGLVTLPDVELKTQGWYMAFQVIQVFLVTTFASGASAVVTDIINDPSSATTLLAQKLPLASNFYICYFVLQGLGIAAGNLLNIGALAMFAVVGKFLDKSPRKMFNRYIKLSGLGWGSLYPKFGNLAIIAITYSIIAPLVLGFATVGFTLIYLATRYNTFYVLTNSINTQGRAYAKALQQLMTGVYLAEVCLIGLFAINTAPGPIVLMVVFLVATAVYHALMRHALRPLAVYLPEGDDGNLFDRADHKSYDADKAGVPPHEAPATSAGKFGTKKASLLQKFFNPRNAKNISKVKSLVPDYAVPAYEEADAELAYYNPNVTKHVPKLWIVRDEMGISEREIKECEQIPGLDVSDRLATFNEKGKVVFDPSATKLEDVPVWEKRIDY